MMMHGKPAILAEGLEKRFGETRALQGRDLAAESMFEYGARVGFWRLHRVFTGFGIPVTLFACARALEANGVRVVTGMGLRSVGARTVQLSDGRDVPADLVLFSVGVRPELALAKAAGLEIGASLHGPVEGAHATDVFFEDLLGMAVRLVDGFRGFLEGREVTELVRHLGDSLGHGAAHGALPIGDDPRNRHVQRLLDLTEKHG